MRKKREICLINPGLTGWHEESSLSGRNELPQCTLGELLAWVAEVEDQGWVCESDLDQW